MICVVIGRTRHKMVQAEVQEAARRGAQLIELRLDYLARQPDFKRLLADKPCPMIATVRRQQDGGRWAGTEEQRRLLLRTAIVSGFDWVDLETDVATEIRRFGKVKRIISYHNHTEVPADLEALYARMCDQDADIVKLAVMAQQPTDNLRILKLLEQSAKPTIAFCMGEVGVPSRLLNGKFGAPFTYGAFSKDHRVAPSIPTFDDLKSIYDYDRINAETALYGVIGDPISHSLSPLIHNAAFRQLGINALYLPFRVPRSMLGSFLNEFGKLGVKGYSVTIPHKEAAALLATTKDESVAVTGSANTLIRQADGFASWNTDYQAGLDSLQSSLPAGSKLEKKPMLILGAGGVGRALACALRQAGAAITLCNRTPERAQKLAGEIGARAIDWNSRLQTPCDILVNCTSVGMHPEVDESPMPASYLRPGMIVMDTIYTPENTLLIKEARAKGCQVRTGVDMFVRQAARQFQLFTGQEPPLELMHKLVKRALSPVTIREEDSGR